MVTIGLYGVAAAGLSYTILALWHVIRFRTRKTSAVSAATFPPVSILQPLCGAEPRLYDALKSFMQQDYPDYQVVWGVRDGSDPAVAVVNRLIREFPDRDTKLVVDARIHGANLKVSNLQNILPACRHRHLVLADSDVLAPPDTVSKLVASLQGDRVGIVTTTYSGIATGSLASKLGALFINDWFLPSVLVDVALYGCDGCYGPLTAVHRPVLEEIGGFETLNDYLAEDNRMGRLVREHGYVLHIEKMPVPTLVNEKHLWDLFTHELRWARTVRLCRPIEHVLEGVMCPLPVLMALAALDPSPAAWGIVALYTAMRMTLNLVIHAKFPQTGRATPWMMPLRECLCFVVWLSSLWGDRIVWRNAEFRLLEGGRIVPVEPEPVLGVTDIAALAGEDR